MFRGAVCVCLILFLMVLTGCFRNPRSDMNAELESLMDAQYSAAGSDLTFALCGWPVQGRMKLKSLDVKISPESDSKYGSGIADIQAEGNGFTCGGKISFTYSYGYTGGHGYSGGTDIKPGMIMRESCVDSHFSNSSRAQYIETGKKITGSFSADDTRLPDGSLADYYYLELKDKNPAVRIITENESSLTVRGCIYQEGKLIWSLPYFGVKLKQGRVVILVTAGESTGSYSMKVEELDDTEKSKLK